MPRSEPMFRHLWLPLDASWENEEALPTAVALAAGRDCRITLVAYALPAAEESTYAGYLEKTADRLRQASLQVDWLVLREGPVAEALVEAAHQHGADLLLLTGRGRSRLARWILGSLCEELSRRADFPLLVVKAGHNASEGIHHILVGLDGTQFSAQALGPVALLARQNRARVTLLTVCPPPVAEEFPSDFLEEKRQELVRAGVDCDVQMAFGDPAPTILQVASERECDLVVVTSHGRQGRERFWLGSVAESVMRHSLCPTLIWKAKQ